MVKPALKAKGYTSLTIHSIGNFLCPQRNTFGTCYKAMLTTPHTDSFKYFYKTVWKEWKMKTAKVLATGFSNRMTSFCVMTVHLAEFCVQIPWKRKKCVKPLPFAIFISPFFLFLICVELLNLSVSIMNMLYY